VTKSDSVDPVVAGALLTYQIEIGNSGPSTARTVWLVDLLPPEVDYVDGVDGTGAAACAELFGVAALCGVGDLDPGQVATVFVAGRVDPATPSGTTLVNTAHAVSETDPDNASTTEETQVVTEADLWIEKSGVRSAGNPSGSLVYRVTVHNDTGSAPDSTPTSGLGGPSDAQDVVMVDDLPLTSKKVVVQFLSPGCTYDSAAHRVTCVAGTLPVGTSVTFEIHVKVKGSVGNIVNAASVASATPDPTPANNSDTVNNVVQGGTS
ncbi:MAG: hypothetical protein ACSLFO_11355, partial [Acidimicrobiales bacterium]